MKRALLLLPVAVLLLANDPIARHPRELKFPPRDYQPPKAASYRHQLASGATAFLVEDHVLPLIQVSVMIRAGEYLEPEGKTGLAQLTGAQIRSGGTKSKPPAVFDEEAAFLAAQIGSSISDVNGQASLNCLKKDIDAGLALFVDMLRNPGFAEERLQLARSQVLQSMERRNDSTASIEGREYQRLMRGARHFTSRQITKASLDAITRDDLVAFHEKYYNPANFIFAVSGDFDTKEMLAKLDRAFAGWSGRKTEVPDPPKPEHTLKPGLYLVDKKDVNQGRARMGHLGVIITNPDHIALAVMNGILGGNQFSSRLIERVRSDEGLAYSTASAFHPGTYYEGTFSVGFQSKSPSVAQAIAIVLEEINKMRDGQVRPDELTTAQNSAIEALPRRFATASDKVSQFADDYFRRLPEDYWQKYIARIRAVDAAEIQRVAKKYLHPDQLVILAVGDTATMLKGNPDRAEYSLAKIAGPSGPIQIPLPDPLTLIYPDVKP